jgi:hypothetical protein
MQISQLTVLVVGMAKVMSEKQVSVPKMEFLGYQMGCKFASKMIISLQWDFETEFYFTNSMACLEMI